MAITQLHERIHDWNSQVTTRADQRLVENVALAGPHSRNGYQYTEEALRQAVDLYNGKPVFLDHAGAGRSPLHRSTRDLVGSIIQPRYEAGRLRGDIRVVDTESGRTFLALIEAQTPGVGMSHVVLAERSPDGQRVERIQQVLSVDVVVNPATTNTFQEATCTLDFSADSAGTPAAAGARAIDQQATPETAERQESGHAASLDPRWLEDQLLQEVQQLRSEQNSWRDERHRLLAELNRLRLLHEQQELQELLQSTGLPAEALDETFRSQLLTSTSQEHRQRLIHERHQLVRRLSLTPPCSSSRVQHGNADNASFVRAIRQHH